MKKLTPDLRVVLLSAATSLVVAVIAMAAWWGTFGGATGDRSVSLPALVRRGAEESSIVTVAKSANPAVVSITVSKDLPVVASFWWPAGTERREIGGGSGFFVSSDGYIVTNRHVAQDSAAEYTVFTNDGQKLPARVVAVDPVLDIAIIKVEGNNFAALQFGDSDKVEVGQTAIAIGNALGEFRNTVSVGVISGLARSIVAGDPGGGRSEALDEVIQTDAAINRGNSGGPLLNLSGEVVGVNVAVAVGSENIGFALPVNNVKTAVAAVIRGGKIVRPFIGIRYVAITEELKARNKLSFDYGVLMARGESPEELAVIPGSPADKAGIVENDIILEIDGIRLTPERRLSSVVRSLQVGDTVNLKLYHRGETKTVKVILEAMPTAN